MTNKMNMLLSEANKCFVCGPYNRHGLQIEFRLEDDVCRAEWTSTPEFTGYEGVTHGGIQFCLLDDVMANLLYLRGLICVTAKAETRYREPLGIGEKVQLYGEMQRLRSRSAIIQGRIVRDSDGITIAESTGHFMIKGSFSSNNT